MEVVPDGEQLCATDVVELEYDPLFRTTVDAATSHRGGDDGPPPLSSGAVGSISDVAVGCTVGGFAGAQPVEVGGAVEVHVVRVCARDAY